MLRFKCDCMNDVVLAQCTVAASECSGGDLPALACTLQPPSVSPLLTATHQPASNTGKLEEGKYLFTK